MSRGRGSPARGAAEYLTSVLSRRGEQALPYGEDVKWTIRQHLLDLAAEFPTLAIKVDKYVHVDGTAVNLLVAEGTLPMYYKGVKYNIPVALWLPERYPRGAPICYVVPTPDMIIKPRHSFVDGSGVVSSPYVAGWAFPRANLVDLAHDTSIQFGQDPPLFSKPPGWVPPPAAAAAAPSSSPLPRPAAQSPAAAAQPPPAAGGAHFQAANPMISSPYQPAAYRPNLSNPSISGSGSGSAADGFAGGSLWTGALNAALSGQAASPSGALPPQSPAGQAGGYPPGPPSPQRPGAAAGGGGGGGPLATVAQGSVKEAFRRLATAALTQRLQAALAAWNAGATAEVDRLLEAQAQLGRRGGEVAGGVAGVARERAALEACVLQLAGQAAALRAWLQAAEARMPAGGDVDPDTAIVAADSLSAQALAAQAEDMAIEDALYAMDKALQTNTIQADVYLKQVRMISRQQYFVRALGMKVAERQHQARRAAVVAQRAVPPASQLVGMAQGDSWTNTGFLANPLAATR